MVDFITLPGTGINVAVRTLSNGYNAQMMRRVNGGAVGPVLNTRPSNTTAYAATSVVGSAMTFASMGEAGDVVRIVRSVLLINDTAIISGETGYLLHLYSVTPPSAFTDGTVFSIPSGDRSSYLGYLNLGAPANLGSTLYVEIETQSKVVALAGTGLFGYLVTIGAYTPIASRGYNVSLFSEAV